MQENAVLKHSNLEKGTLMYVHMQTVSRIHNSIVIHCGRDLHLISRLVLVKVGEDHGCTLTD